MYVVKFNHYIYLVPFVTGDDGTIFPNRKATQKYLKEVNIYEKKALFGRVQSFLI